ASLTDSSRRASSRGPFAPSSAVPLCSMNMTRSAMNQSPKPIALRISPSYLSPDSLGDSLPDRDGKAPDLSSNPGTLFLLRISASPAPVTGGACTAARLSGAASRTLRLPRFDFRDGLAQLPGLFLDEALEVVAHEDAELGVDLVVPLLEPGEKLDEAGQEGDEAGVVAAAETFLDFNKIGADRPGELEVVVAGPGDDERAVRALAVGEAHPALLGDVELAAEPPVVALKEVGARVLGRNGNRADLLLLERFGGQLAQVVGMVPGELCPGVYRVFLPLERPGLFPLLALAQARGFVAKDRQKRDTLGLDQLGHEAGDVESGVVAVKLADLVELGVLAGDVGQPGDGGQRHPASGGGRARIVHPAVEIEVGFEAVQEPGP